MARGLAKIFSRHDFPKPVRLCKECETSPPSFRPQGEISPVTLNGYYEISPCGRNDGGIFYLLSIFRNTSYASSMVGMLEKMMERRPSCSRSLQR